MTLQKQMARDIYLAEETVRQYQEKEKLNMEMGLCIEHLDEWKKQRAEKLELQKRLEEAEKAKWRAQASVEAEKWENRIRELDDRVTDIQEGGRSAQDIYAHVEAARGKKLRAKGIL